jgi:hypothetical protein
LRFLRNLGDFCVRKAEPGLKASQKKSLAQRLRRMRVRDLRLGNHAAHLDEFMRHAAVNLKVDVHA